jgi:type IV fimbrial biogenesis protein FimT
LNNDANTVVFNGFGRALDATGMSTIDIDNITSGDDYRALRIVVGTGGTLRMCEPKVTASSDPRKC